METADETNALAKEVLRCIRQAPLKIHANDVRFALFFQGRERLPVVEKIAWLNEQISRGMGLRPPDIREFVSDDSFGFLSTTPALRPLIDVWIQYDRFSSYATSVLILEDTIVFTLSARTAVRSKQEQWACAEGRVMTNTLDIDQHGDIVRIARRLDRIDVLKKINAQRRNKTIKLNLDNTLVENLCLSGDKYRDKEFEISAKNAVFSGSLVLEDILFTAACFDGAVLVCDDETRCISFARSTFLQTSEEPTPTFRNAFIAADRMVFDGVKMLGESPPNLSFEDASIRPVSSQKNCIISFNYASLLKTSVNFFQTVAPQAQLEFVLTKLAEGELCLEDSTFNTVRFLNINNFLSADFRFRHCNRLELLACELTQALKFGDERAFKIKTISFDQSTNNGCSILSPAVRKGKCALVEAINTAHSTASNKQSLAQQLQVVKEVFHNMGSYEHEDAAYVAYKKACSGSICRRSGSFFLRHVGKYGTSPWSILAVIGILYVVLCGVNLLVCHRSVCEMFSVLHATGLAMMTFQLPETFIEGLACVEAIRCLALVEGLVQWFFLGYFVMAFTRKTLR